MRIKVYPDQSGENQFIQNIRRQIDQLEGARVEGVPLNHFRLFLRLPYDVINRSDYTVTNWLENNVCSNSGRFSVLGGMKFLGLLLLFRMTSKRLIYVRHNFYPHKLRSRYSTVAKAIVDGTISVFCDKVALSEHMVDQGYRYVPHPLYRFPSIEFDPEEECGDDPSCDEYFVIFGTISRYKGIDKVVRAWRGDRHLLIIGKVGDAAYLEELADISTGRNVTIRGGRLSDINASRIISRSLGVILPHESDEMIVSGAFFYSVALGARTYAVKSSFYERLVRDRPFPGLELFDGSEHLVERLVGSPVECFRSNRESIRRHAQRCFGDDIGVAKWKALLNDCH